MSRTQTDRDSVLHHHVNNGGFMGLSGRSECRACRRLTACWRRLPGRAAHQERSGHTLSEHQGLSRLSSPKRRHGKILQSNFHAVVAVFHLTFEWRKIAVVQMGGAASVLAGGRAQDGARWLQEALPSQSPFCCNSLRKHALLLPAQLGLLHRQSQTLPPEIRDDNR